MPTAVTPSLLSSDERSDMQDRHGVCWNTDDDFEKDYPELSEVVAFHKAQAEGHWYFPDHESLKYQSFATETEAYEAAAACSKQTN